jgi:hypothetical protein
MKRRASLVVAVVLLGVAGSASAQVVELQGSWVIDGYRFDPGDRTPGGRSPTIATRTCSAAPTSV